MSTHRITPEQEAELIRRGATVTYMRLPAEASAPEKLSKYRNIKTEVDGIVFHSKREARRYLDLKALQAAGKISGLTLQPRYELYVNGKKVGVYTADFRYVEGAAIVVEDVKSSATKTTAYRLRKKMVEAQYGIRVVEV